MSKTIQQLYQLENEVSRSSIPCASRPWSGADVVISKTTPQSAPQSKGRGFYPDPRYVITEHALEVSGLFERLRDAFYAENRLDSCSKIEFFGRLANAANRCLQRIENPTAHQVCDAVLREAFAIYEEMEKGTFQCFDTAIGNEIVGDYADD
ncbi:MAG: hypothetical protein AB1743_06960 [Actinomycetota bacterium]